MNSSSIDSALMKKLMGQIDVFEMKRQAAKRLVAAEKSGGPIPSDLNFSVTEQCTCCRKEIYPPQTPKRCSQCRAVIYCSAKCARDHWNRGDARAHNSPTHKDLCTDNKRHMERVPATQDILKLFPWGQRVEKDGTFADDILRARFDVLGGTGYGYWSQRGGYAPHVASGVAPAVQERMFEKFIKRSEFVDGIDLLNAHHLSDQEGWRLPPQLIPYLDFSNPAAKRPLLVTELPERISDWQRWYQWRGLPLESPAAVLMAVPLSVYQLLVRCLQVTKPHAGLPEHRKPLVVHLVGAEVELNYIPLFAELALLLPYHDIKLVLFGGAVKTIVDAARKKPGAIAARDVVYSYTAPDACGAGSLTIHLHGSAEFWTPDILSKETPNAIVACNAGLLSYREWIPILGVVHAYEIPMAVTEYAEQSIEAQIAAFPEILSSFPMRVSPRAEYPYTLNPFQRPGQRQMPAHRLPNVSNGFTLTVVKK